MTAIRGIMGKKTGYSFFLIISFVAFAIMFPPSGHASLAGALHNAAGKKSPKKLKKLIAKGADLNAKTHWQEWTALHYAVNRGRAENMRILLEAGADPNSTDKYQFTPLMYAVYPLINIKGAFPIYNKGMEVEATKLLLAHGADPNRKDYIGMTALMYSVRRGRADLAELLLEAGADPRLRNNGGKTAAVWAQGGHFGLVKLLEKAEANAPARAAMRARRKAMAIAQEEMKGKLPLIEAAEKAGDEARQAGDSEAALSHYAAAIKDAPIITELGFRLREKVLKYALTLKPKPSIPREAEHRVSRGYAFLKRAKSVAGYHSAIVEFEKAVALAPWSPRNYFNLGLVQEKALDYSGAIRSFKLYLIGSPDAPDAGKVRRKLGALEVAQEMAER